MGDKESCHVMFVSVGDKSILDFFVNRNPSYLTNGSHIHLCKLSNNRVLESALLILTSPGYLTKWISGLTDNERYASSMGYTY